MLSRRDFALKQVKHKYNQKDLNDKSIIEEQMYMIDYVNEMGFEYITDLSGYQIEFTNLNKYKRELVFKYKIIPLLNIKKRDKVIGVFNFNTPFEILNKLYFNKIVFLDKSFEETYFNYVLMGNHKNYKNRFIRFYNWKLINEKIIKGTKPIKLLDLKYGDSQSVIIYLSHFITYIIINHRFFEFDFTLQYIEKDFTRMREVLNYYMNHHNKIKIIDGIGIKNEIKENSQVFTSINKNIKVTTLNNEKYKLLFNEFPG